MSKRILRCSGTTGDESLAESEQRRALETDTDLALVDHESFPGGRQKATARALERAGQLAACAEALEAASGRACWGQIYTWPCREAR